MLAIADNHFLAGSKMRCRVFQRLAGHTEDNCQRRPQFVGNIGVQARFQGIEFLNALHFPR